MDRRRFLISGLAAVMAAGTAQAESYADGIVRQLKRQGFDRITVERTLLGRVRIVATSREGRREIIVNPRTGEILRDLWTESGKGSSDRRKILEDGESDSRDSRSGDDKTDDKDDDHSGSGSSGSNSGSGSSGSGSNSGSGSSGSNSGSGSSGSNSGSGGGGDDDDDDDDK